MRRFPQASVSLERENEEPGALGLYDVAALTRGMVLATCLRWLWQGFPKLSSSYAFKGSVGVQMVAPYRPHRRFALSVCDQCAASKRSSGFPRTSVWVRKVSFGGETMTKIRPSVACRLSRSLKAHTGARRQAWSALVLSALITLLGYTACHAAKHREVIIEQFRYDSNGRLVCRVAPDGAATTLRYNEQGLLSAIRYPDGWVRYGYDESGNRIWMKDKMGTTEYYYDFFDRLIGVIWRRNPLRLIVYDYDPWGYLARITIFNLQALGQDLKYRETIREFEMKHADTMQEWHRRESTLQRLLEQLRSEDSERAQRWQEYEVQYRHDLLGNLTNVDTPWGSISYSYYPDRGQVVRRLPNGITSRFTYTPEGLLKSLRHENSLGRLVVEYEYSYDAAGKVIRAQELTSQGVRATEYVWDTRGYLKELHLPDGNTIRYSYDAMGNRLLKEDPAGVLRYQYDGFGRLTWAGNVQCQWDRVGNMVSRTKNKVKTKVEYDGKGLPALVRGPDTTTRYGWDGDGNMILRQQGKDVTHYLPNVLAPSGFTLEEFDSIGRLASAYWYGDVLLGQCDGAGRMRYFLEDGFNSIRYIVDGDGRILGQQDYTPFGQPVATRGDTPFTFRVAGERFLPEIESYVIGGRLYDPSLGQYFSPDRMAGYPERFDSFNGYAHGCNASAVFMEPRCNQTRQSKCYPHKTHPWNVRGSGYLYSTRSEDRWRTFLRNTPQRSIDLVLLGTGNRWDDAVRFTEEYFPNGEGICFPAFSAWLNVVGDVFACGYEKVAQTFGPFGRVLMTRKSPVDERLTDAWNAGKPIISLTYESGAGFELMREIPSLVEWARDNPGKALPLIIVESTEIGKQDYERLRQAGYRVVCIAEKGLVPTVVQPSRDRAGCVAKIPVAGEVLGAGVQIVDALWRVFSQGRGSVGRHGIRAWRSEIDLVRHTNRRLRDIGCFVLLASSAASKTAKQTMVSTGLNSFKYFYRPKVLAYANTKENAEEIAQFIRRKRPDAEIVIYVGDLESVEDIRRIGIEKGAVCVLGLVDRKERRKGEISQGGGIRKRDGLQRDEIYDDLRKYWAPPPSLLFSGAAIGVTDPFRAIEDQMGGIELASTAESVEIQGNIVGAVFDEDKRCLVLLCDQAHAVQSITLEELAVALISVFSPTPQDLRFSLDPADPKNPRGKWLKAVYTPGFIGGTLFGKAMFEADWLLKQYSFGVSVDRNGDVRKRESTVQGFKSTADLWLEEQGHEYGRETWARFWIVSEEMKLRQSGNSIYFDVAKMRVKAKRQVPDPSSPTGLRDVDIDEPVATKFADLFTELYDEIAKESPEFERVRQLAKTVALAKWLKREGIPVDTDWVVRHATKRVETVGQITALSVQWQSQNQVPYSEGGRTGIQTVVRQVHLFGGVDLAVNPTYVSDDGNALSLEKAVRSKLRLEDTGPVFVVRHNDKPLRGIVLPFTEGGREIWGRLGSIERNGIIYQVTRQGSVTRSLDESGTTIEYESDTGGGLRKVIGLSGNNWKIIGERVADGSAWTATNLRGNTIACNYEAAGYLREIKIDGKTWASYAFDPNKCRISIRYYDGSTERITYDGDGNIREYEIEGRRVGATSGVEAEKVVFGYDGFGNLTNISGSGIPSVKIFYTEDGLKPTKVRAGQVELQYGYDLDGRLQAVKHSNGTSVMYGYEGEHLSMVRVRCRDKEAEYTLDENGITRSRDLLGCIADYDYTGGKLNSVLLHGYGQAKYVYDDAHGLKEVTFPNGSKVEYRYQERKGLTSTKQPQGLLLTVTTHSRAGDTIRTNR